MIFSFFGDSMEIPYEIRVIYSEEDGGYIAFVPELPGCNAFGETLEEVIDEIKYSIELWIETAKELGREIPKPKRNCAPIFEGEVGIV